MIVEFGILDRRADWPGCVVCLGTFDGVHLGHQHLLCEAVDRAGAMGLPSVAVTFDRHPIAILQPDREPPHLMTLDQKIRAFASSGIDLVVVLGFSPELARKSAQAFWEQIIVGSLGAQQAVIGHDFVFGHERQGTGAWLAERMPTVVVPPFLVDGERVSSRLIRQAIAEGNVAQAARWLGRDWAMTGVVVTGQQLGRTLGYPTANIQPSEKSCVPAHGIYGGWCETPSGSFLAAISIGTRPTVSGEGRTIEAFLLDYPGVNLYGKVVELGFQFRIRSEEKFDSLAALIEQMEKDVAVVRKGRQTTS